MPASPNSGQFDVQVIAKLLMIEPRRVQQLVAEGFIPKGPERGKYSLVGSVQGYIKYLKEHSRETGRGSQQQRLAAAQAAKVEMENYRRMGVIVTEAQAEETCTGLVSIMRAGHEALPGRLANELAGLEPAAIYQRLQGELRSVLDQCADFLEKRADALEAMPEPSAPAATDATTAPGDLGIDE